MRSAAVGIGAAVGLVIAVAVWAQQEPKSRAGSPVGTWKLTSYEYGDQPAFAEPPANRCRIKLITETHFTWVEYDTQSRKAGGMAGRKYSLEGDMYTESIDFSDSGMATYLEGKHAFTIRVEGDKFHLKGSLKDGLHIEEVWERVK